MIKLDIYFGSHTGSMKIYFGIFQIGLGTFTVFNNSEIDFSGSYRTLGQVGTFSIGIQLTNGNPTAASGPCKVMLNGDTDAAAKYRVNGQKLTITTKLNPAPVTIYPSQGGTQVEGISGHNLWIGQWQAA
jgi:hypothetical protein